MRPRGIGAEERQVGDMRARCPYCAERLVLRRAQLSPPAWGALLITEWYSCIGCEAQYAYSPIDKRWAVATEA